MLYTTAPLAESIFAKDAVTSSHGKEALVRRFLRGLPLLQSHYGAG